MTSRRWHKRPEPPTPLFAPLANSSRTSQLAAATAEKTGRAHSQRARVLAELRRRGETGATNEELAEALGVAEKSICGPRHQLVEAHLAKISDRTRPTRLGGQAAVIVSVTTTT